MTSTDFVTGREVREGAPSSLIASDRVEGTPVRRHDGTNVGTIERLLIEKVSGRVAYAVMGFGGFLGMGEDHHLLPWNVLRYDTELDAYALDLTDDQLRGTPRRLSGGQDPSIDPAWEEHVHHYFNTPPYWNEAAPRASEEARSR